MDKKFYQDLFSKHTVPPAVAEAQWNSRASHFNATQSRETTGIPQAVLEFLMARGILKDAKIIDIGGGSGRYAIPLAAQSAHVTMTDISENMLEHARENAAEAGLSNLTYAKLDWGSADLEALGWSENFDLAFASMCPAVRSIEGLENMVRASKGYGLINQFILDQNSLTMYLEKALGIVRHHNPHNDRDSVQAFFNLLWMDGLNPEIHYVETKDSSALSAEEAVESFSVRYNVSTEKMDEFIQAYRLQYGDIVLKERRLAMIFWKSKALKN